MVMIIMPWVMLICCLNRSILIILKLSLLTFWKMLYLLISLWYWMTLRSMRVIYTSNIFLRTKTISYPTPKVNNQIQIHILKEQEMLHKKSKIKLKIRKSEDIEDDQVKILKFLWLIKKIPLLKIRLTFWHWKV